MSALQERVELHAYPRRWWILAVLCISLLTIVLDNTVLNVAIPTLSRPRSLGGIGASDSELQWIIDSYTLVFAGLLLTCGSLGDRFGRRGALQLGLVIFGLGSVASAFANSSTQLITTRACMGVGGAFIMPATLSIITNVFPGPERGKAIGFWAATAGLASVLGPVTAGFLLAHFYWGSVFLINVPVVIIGLLAGFFLIPTSKDPSAPRLDPIGGLLSIASLVAILYAIIEAPTDGWGDPTIVACFVVGGVLLLAFLLWENHSDHPMLDVGFFKNPRFTAASNGIMLVFFAMFGTAFLFTQYLQFVLGFTPLQAGVRFLPFAATILIVSPSSARIVHRLGTKIVVGSGLALVAFGLIVVTGLDETSSYWPDVVWRFILLAIGMALTMAPATESIMGSLPRAKAGVGSAVNDTTRQVGGALGVAVIGSVLASTYSAGVSQFLRGKNVPTGEAEAYAHSTLGYALTAGKGVTGLAQAATSAFVDGMHTGVLVGAAAAAAGAVIAFVFLPARADHNEEDIEHERALTGVGAATVANGEVPNEVVPQPAMET
jgi:EmrB/QacA subfamily drug resistance transporter